MGLGLADFAGCWTIRRRIDDRRRMDRGEYEGQARFVPDGATLIYHEAGVLTYGGSSMASERRHVWRSDGARILVSFDDGQPFHDFDSGVLQPTARHLCPPDTYDVVYDFGAWPIWTCSWTVLGPRKDYRMDSTYAPGDQSV